MKVALLILSLGLAGCAGGSFAWEDPMPVYKPTPAEAARDARDQERLKEIKALCAQADAVADRLENGNWTPAEGKQLGDECNELALRIDKLQSEEGR